MLPCRYEFEDIPIINNAILSTFDDGQIVLNDIYDGRALFSVFLDCTVKCAAVSFTLYHQISRSLRHISTSFVQATLIVFSS